MCIAAERASHLRRSCESSSHSFTQSPSNTNTPSPNMALTFGRCPRYLQAHGGHIVVCHDFSSAERIPHMLHEQVMHHTHPNSIIVCSSACDTLFPIPTRRFLLPASRCVHTRSPTFRHNTCSVLNTTRGQKADLKRGTFLSPCPGDINDAFVTATRFPDLQVTNHLRVTTSAFRTILNRLPFIHLPRTSRPSYCVEAHNLVYAALLGPKVVHFTFHAANRTALLFQVYSYHSISSHNFLRPYKGMTRHPNVFFGIAKGE